MAFGWNKALQFTDVLLAVQQIAPLGIIKFTLTFKIIKLKVLEMLC